MDVAAAPLRRTGGPRRDDAVPPASATVASKPCLRSSTPASEPSSDQPSFPRAPVCQLHPRIRQFPRPGRRMSPLLVVCGEALPATPGAAPRRAAEARRRAASPRAVAPAAAGGSAPAGGGGGRPYGGTAWSGRRVERERRRRRTVARSAEPAAGTGRAAPDPVPAATPGGNCTTGGPGSGSACGGMNGNLFCGRMFIRGSSIGSLPYGTGGPRHGLLPIGT